MPVQKVFLLNQNTPVVIPSGLVPKGAYNGATDYAVGDSVDYNGSSYVMYVDAAAGTLPTDTTKWQVLANKGDTGATGADSTVPGPAGADGLTVSVNSVTQVAGDISLTQDNIPDGTTNKAYTATEQSKLSGIEAGADVTDTANVTSAGALMDSELTNITAVKALNQGVATTDSPTFAGVATSQSGSGLMEMLNLTGTGAFAGSQPAILFKNTAGAITTAEISSKPGSAYAASELRIRVSNNAKSLQERLIIDVNGAVRPGVDSTSELGTSSYYWSNTYTDRLYLNSTAYLDGGTAGIAKVTGDIEITDTTKGVILTAPNASRWRITVDNSGNLTTTSI